MRGGADDGGWFSWFTAKPAQPPQPNGDILGSAAQATKTFATPTNSSADMIAGSEQPANNALNQGVTQKPAQAANGFFSALGFGSTAKTGGGRSRRGRRNRRSRQRNRY